MATKKCPYCAEEIQEEAIFCRYCKNRLDKPLPEEGTVQERKRTELEAVNQSSSSTSPTAKKQSPHGTSTAAKVLGIVGGSLGIICALISGLTAGVAVGVAQAFAGKEAISDQELTSSMGMMFGLGMLGAFLSLFGGMLAARLPKTSGAMQLFGCAICCMPFFSTFNFLGVAAIILMLIGGIIALAQKKEYVDYTDPSCRFRWSKAQVILFGIFAAIGLCTVIACFTSGSSYGSGNGNDSPAASGTENAAAAVTDSVVPEKADMVIVPDFTYRTYDRLKDLFPDFNFTASYAENFNYADGNVLSQDIKPGTEVKKGTEIKVTVNKKTTAKTTTATAAVATETVNYDEYGLEGIYFGMTADEIEAHENASLFIDKYKDFDNWIIKYKTTLKGHTGEKSFYVEKNTGLISVTFTTDDDILDELLNDMIVIYGKNYENTGFDSYKRYTWQLSNGRLYLSLDELNGTILTYLFDWQT